MFGDEATSDAVRPLNPPVVTSGVDKRVFFDDDVRDDDVGSSPDSADSTDETDSESVDEPSLFPDLTFDPTATGAYSIDLTEPDERVGETDVVHDSAVTLEGSVIDLTDPEPSFSLSFDRTEPSPQIDVVPPSSQGWLQQSLFPAHHHQAPTLGNLQAAPEGRSLLDRLNYGSIEDIENIRWFHRPVVWLVFGLLTVLILFLALLVQNDSPNGDADDATVSEAAVSEAAVT